MVKRCGKCGNEHEGTFGSGKFCSRACANSRNHSDVSKSKIGVSLKGRRNPRRVDLEKSCITCGRLMVLTGTTKNRKYCSVECKRPALQAGGRITGMRQGLIRNPRSKNEILFATLCEDLSQDIVTNQPIFDGWDADVILRDHKVAVLWNGPWHYRKITKSHSVEQVQNRDKIKLKKIEESGYTSYVIRDNGNHNPKFVAEQFDVFKRWIGELAITRLS